MPLQRLFLVSLSLILTTTFLVSITAGTEAAAATNRTSTSSTHSYNGSGSSSSSRSSSRRRIGDCSREAEVEFLMDTETHRRLLEQGKTIGYGALHPDRPACNAGAGQSYSGNCIPPRSGNMPGRGCESNYYCRSRHH